MPRYTTSVDLVYATGMKSSRDWGGGGGYTLTLVFRVRVSGGLGQRPQRDPKIRNIAPTKPTHTVDTINPA